MYNKLFTSILDSSIWLEPSSTRIVWVTFIAAMDEDGFVRMATIKNVANRARVSEKEAEEAIECLELPDMECPDQERQGRRIERVEGGWMVLNSQKYRDLVNREKQREQARIRVANLRARRAAAAANVTHVTQGNEKVTRSEAAATAEAEAETKKKREAFRPPTLEEVKLLMAKAGLPESEAEKFWNYYGSNGWKVGRNPMRSVSHAVGHWKANYETYRSVDRKVADRNAGTFNAGKASQYRDVGKVG